MFPHSSRILTGSRSRGRDTRTSRSKSAPPDQLPFPEATFDLVAALDVLEHVEDDVGALDALIHLVKPGGYIVITVPTHPFLWGSHDRRLHHVRRYSVGHLRTMCEESGAEVVYFGAFNTILAPIAFAVRLAEKALRITSATRNGCRRNGSIRSWPPPLRSRAGWFDTSICRSACRRPWSCVAAPESSPGR